MDKAQKLNAFWNSFKWKAYDESTVPDDAELPRITYSVSIDNLGNPVMMNASLWDRSTSWKSVTNKVNEISEVIDNLYPPALKVDGGRMYLTKGTPFAQRLSDPSDDALRRVYVNIVVEYFTEH